MYGIFNEKLFGTYMFCLTYTDLNKIIVLHVNLTTIVIYYLKIHLLLLLQQNLRFM